MLNISSIAETEKNQTFQTSLIPMPYSHLTNFILECLNMNTDDFEILLSYMPSALRLDLGTTFTSVKRWFDGSFLKKLISDKLPQLKHLKYRFTTKPSNYDELESIITPFRTPFWCEEKRWFFSCTFSARFPRVLLTLESPPTKMTTLDQCPFEHYFSVFNIPVSIHRRVTIDTVRSVYLSLEDMMVEASKTQVSKTRFHDIRFMQSIHLSNSLHFLLLQTNYANYYYLSHPTHLSLYTHNEWRHDWLRSLLSLMELVHLESLSLELSGDHADTLNSLLDNIKILLDRASNVHAFLIKNNSLSINKICPIVPRRIKSLTLWVRAYQDMETVLKRLDYLSTVTFKYNNPGSLSKVFARTIQGLIREKKTFTHKEAEGSLEIHFQQNNTLH